MTEYGCLPSAISNKVLSVSLVMVAACVLAGRFPVHRQAGLPGAIARTAGGDHCAAAAQDTSGLRDVPAFGQQ